MKLRHLGAALIVLACMVSAAKASPRHRPTRHDSAVASQCVETNSGRTICRVGEGRSTGHLRVAAGHSDPRPAAWCGWWLRRQLGVADRLYNLARAWVHYGSRANGPAPGVIAVYPHHVGIVVAVPGPGRIVMKSGNDGHAVRTRERSIRGVIAWRWPPQRMAGL
jgi:hypothetical protein